MSLCDKCGSEMCACSTAEFLGTDGAQLEIERLQTELATAKEQGEDAWSSGFDSLEHDIAKALGCEDDVSETVVEKVRWLAQKRVPALEAELARLETDGPRGLWTCDECQLSLVVKAINMKEGTIGVLRIQKVPECSNDCGPMRPVTWKEASANQDAGAKRMHEVIDEKESEIERLRAELDRRKGDPVTRLHNLCEGIGRDADGSEFSREEWERIDAENLELRKKLKRFAVRILRGHGPKDHACMQCYPDSDVLVDGFVCVYHEAVEIDAARRATLTATELKRCDHEFADTRYCVKCGWVPPEFEDTDCPGEGRCHGSMDWCEECGTVRDVCDDVGCDVHRQRFLEAQREDEEKR